nr:homeodomain-like protein [Tanacetum cinerariifolium]
RGVTIISTETSDGLAAIQAQLNNLGREIKNVNEKVYAAQVGCKLCKGPHYTKDFPLKEEGKALKEAYYTQFGEPFPQGGQYRAAALGFYQRNNANPSYQERRQSMEVNQGASIKTLKIQIGQMSKVLQERGFGSLPGSTETNPRDHVKSISTTVEADLHSIHRTGRGRYAVSDLHDSQLIFVPCQTTIPFPSRLYVYQCDEEEGSYGLKDSNAYSIGTTLHNDALPQKEKDLESFTLPFVKNMDAYRDEGIGEVIIGEPFYKASYVEARRFDRMITIFNGNDGITYQMVQSHPRFKHITHIQCNKIPPLLKVSEQDKMNGISHSYQKLKGFYKGILDLGLEFIQDEKIV